MTELQLAEAFNCTGMERNARKVLLSREFAKPEEVAVMTVLDVRARNFLDCIRSTILNWEMRKKKELGNED